MQPPKQSKFASRIFKVQYPEELESGGEECDGLCHVDKRLLEVKKTLVPHLKAETLVHETLHQMVAFSGLGLSDDDEERIVDFFAKALMAHMGDNRQYWGYVQNSMEPK